MRGFLVGSMALIVLYAVTQTGAADRVGAAGTVSTKWLRHLISPNYAGVPQRASITKATK